MFENLAPHLNVTELMQTGRERTAKCGMKL